MGSPQTMSFQFRPIFILMVASLILVEMIVVSPSPLEKSDEKVPLEDLNLVDDGVSGFSSVPKDKPPDYLIRKFNYTASSRNKKEWRLVAKTAFLFNRERLIHARTIKTDVYDSENKATLITGDEALYHLEKKDMEAFGNVTSLFPDGFTIKAPYIKYYPETKMMEVPKNYPVYGTGPTSDGHTLSFRSHGMRYNREAGLIELLTEVEVTTQDTTIWSDYCSIEQKKEFARFSMENSRPLSTRFVKITQPTLITIGRLVEMSYGGNPTTINWMRALEDVTIEEKKEETGLTRYATAGQADFSAKTNQIILTKYPQVYQDQDTVTGETIIIYRDKDLVEVEHSNAYSDGSLQKDTKD